MKDGLWTFAFIVMLAIAFVYAGVPILVGILALGPLWIVLAVLFAIGLLVIRI